METISVPRIIQKKRDRVPLSSEEIDRIVRGAVDGSVPEYQLSSFLMATFFTGMSFEETANLTRSMIESGEQYNLSGIPGPKVDKHSTGGLGDKVSIILAPLAAACGLKVPMMAGRGLGHTGGTIDKLESIPGFRVVLEKKKFTEIIEKTGCAIISQSATIAPADRILYALRDVTATIECIPLITASILSKKIAEGANSLVMDIKVGNGAFLKRKTDAMALAKTMRAVAKLSNMELRATLSNMDQPLGYAVGNALEILECVEVLRDQDLNPQGLPSPDLKELTIHLCAQMLEAGKLVRSLPEGRKLALSKLHDGSAWRKFLEMVAAQGGNSSFFDDPLRLMRSERTWEIKAVRKGYVSGFECEELGRLLISMGGGRNRVNDPIDHSVGFFVHKKLGSTVKKGEVLVTAFGNEKTDFRLIEERIHSIITITTAKKSAPKLILEANAK